MMLEDVAIVVVCDRSGSLLGETVGGIRDSSPQTEVFAVGRGLAHLVPRSGMAVVNVGAADPMSAAVKRCISGCGKKASVVVREGVLFCVGSLGGMMETLEANPNSVVTPTCRLVCGTADATVYGAVITMGKKEGKNRFSDVFDLEPSTGLKPSRRAMGVFPGCYAFSTQWFLSVDPWDGLYGSNAMALAFSVSTWLHGGSCIVSESQVRSSVWSSFEMVPANWRDYLDKIRIAFAMTPPTVAGRIIMSLPECEDKKNAMMEMRSAMKDILAEKRKFEVAVLAKPDFERFGVEI